MSGLRERLQQAQRPETRLTILGETFVVVGLSRSERSRVFADHRKKDGSVDTQALEARLLCLCVHDSEGCKVCDDDPQWWDDLPAAYTGPLIAEIMRTNGMDDEDVGREAKNSSTTDVSA